MSDDREIRPDGGLDRRSPGPARTPSHVVGIGASAGGLEAFGQLLRHLPADTGMAFVLVQHLDPSHESALAGLLSRETAMPVVEATDGLTAAPDTVYVMPAAQDLTIEGGTLRLQDRSSSGPHLPIDLFLAALARDRGRRAIGVVLSGTAEDGSAGLQAVKAAGGVTMAQDPDTATHRGMPASAIATGAVDVVLPVPLLARHLVLLGRQMPPGPEAREPVTAGAQQDRALAELLSLIQAATGADFGSYKQGTVSRRIGRRMAIRRVDSLDEYVRLLRQDPVEVQALYQDMLIRVTSFFRQPAVFDTLKRDVFPKIAEARAGGQVRFWVPGCSTGEEAFSLAIAWTEFAEANGLENTSFLLFASDINQLVIDKAREGTYPQGIAADVSPERITRFFDAAGANYRIVKSVREKCVFARHDLTRDPPFSDLDLVSLRNVLIYLGPLLQRRIMPLLHFALRARGFLVLGESESVAGFTDLFAPVDRRNKIFARKDGPVILPLDLPSRTRKTPADTPVSAPPSEEFDVAGEADRVVLDRYTPAGVIVDANLQILQFRGRTGPYLEPGPGRASFDLMRMAREGLSHELREAIREAAKGSAAVQRSAMRLHRDRTPVTVDLDVTPLRSPTGETYFLILFRDSDTPFSPEPEAGCGRGAEGTGDNADSASRLQREISDLRVFSRISLEEKESANEELRTVNEELQSSNEELQSLNEEFATAQEELHASNEELQALNERLQGANTALMRRDEELRAARAYAEAVVDTVREPLLVVDQDLRILSANAAFYRTFAASPRLTLDHPLHQLDDGRWDAPELHEALSLTLAGHAGFQDLVLKQDSARFGKRTMLLSGRLIQQGATPVKSVLLAIEDITVRRQAESDREQLLAATGALAAWTELDGVLELLTETLLQSIDHSRVTVYVWEEMQRELTVAFSRGTLPLAPGTVFPLDTVSTPVREALAARLTRAVDYDTLPDGTRGLTADIGGHLGLAVPLVSASRLLGVIMATDPGERREFADREIRLIEAIAAQAAVAIEHARLYAEKRDVAETLQQALLRVPADLDAIEVGHLHRSATESADVGGDFYDVFHLAERRFGISIGDVSGKGIHAAERAGLVKNAIKAYAHVQDSPAAVLGSANHLLVTQSPGVGFVSAFFGILDLERHTLTYSSAGHPPAIVRSKDGLALLSTGSIVLGVLEAPTYVEKSVPFAEGDLLLLYTDGITEARDNRRRMFGQERLLAWLRRSPTLPAPDLPAALLEKVLSWSQETLRDDVAVLAVARLTSARPSG